MISGEVIPTLGWTWLAATVALGLHVADEAAHNFLGWYNPQVLRMRHYLGNIPFPPTFTFVPWLTGLVAGILLLLALTPLAFAGIHWMRPLAYVLATIHIANGTGHIVGSLVVKRWLPGVLSAPLLLASGAWLAYVAATVP
jgi:hypothetical protein